MAKLNWNDRQKAAFICGWLAGTSLSNTQAPFVQIDTVLNPFGVGGTNERAICIGNAEYDGEGIYRLPVYAYNINLSPPMDRYTGFTARINISDTRLTFIGLSAGEHFDPAYNLIYKFVPGNILVVQGLTDGNYIDRNTGEYVDFDIMDFQAYGLAPYITAEGVPQGSKAEMEILFYLILQVSGIVTSTTPINIPLLYKDGQVTNTDPVSIFTSLITFLDGADIPGSVYVPGWSYMVFVTPLAVVGGRIVSDLKGSNTGVLGSPSPPLNVKPTPATIIALMAFAPPNKKSALGLVVTYDYKAVDGNSVKSVKAVFRVENNNADVGMVWEVEAAEGWTLTNTATSHYPDGSFTITVEADSNNESYSPLFAYILATFAFENKQMRVPVVPISATLTYKNTGDEQLVQRMGGAFYYWPESSITDAGTTWGGTGGGVGVLWNQYDYENDRPYTGGFIAGEGVVISDSEGIVIIQWNGAPPVPVWVEPGENEVEFFIPIIIPGDEPELVDAPLTITPPPGGTIFIPAGFQIIKKAGNNTEVVPTLRLTDRLSVSDFYAFEFAQPIAPTNIEPIVDELYIADFNDTELLHVRTGERATVDEIGFGDFIDSEIVSVVVHALESIDDVLIQDLVDIVLESDSEEPVTPDRVIDKLDITDKITVEHFQDVSKDGAAVEQVRFEDFTDFTQ